MAKIFFQIGNKTAFFNHKTQNGKNIRDKTDETDEKIIAIPFGDPHYNGYRDIMSLPAHILDELKHFLSVYKQLEHKEVNVFRVGSCDEAKVTIQENIDEFNRNFLNK